MAAMLVIGCGSAWADDLTTMVGQVGPANNSGGAFVNHSKNVVIKDGEKYVYYLTNYNDGGNFYNNWIFEAYDASNKWIDFRADGGYWGEAGASKTFAGTDYNGVSNWMTEYNGAKVTLTVTYSEGTMVMTNKSVLSGGAEYTNSLTTTGLSGDLTMRFTNELSHQFIEKVVYTDAAGTNTTYTAGTLVHTAAVQGGSNASGTTIDAESHYYNNFGTSGWAAQAYIGFSVTIPSDETLTGATLQFYSNCGGSKDGRTVEVWSLSDVSNFDWENLSLSAGKGIKIGNATDNRSVQRKSFDVLADINKHKDGNVIYQLGGAAAGATLQGKASTTYVPMLEIVSVQAATYSAKFTELNSLVPTVTIYSDIDRKTEVTNGALLDGATYYYRATLDGYKDFNGEFSVNKSNPSVEFTMVEKQVCNYTVKISTGVTLYDIQIASGSVLEGESVTVSVPRYINVDGTLYETAKNGTDWYHHTYTITSDNQVETVNYTATSIKNIECYVEAEDLVGAITGNGNSTRTSKGLTAYGTNLSVCNLKAGIYKIYVHAANGNSSDRNASFKAGESSLYDFVIANKNNNQDIVSGEIVVAEDADITLTSEGSSASGVDFFYIQKLAPAAISRTTATDKYGTICAPFAAKVEGANVYSASINDDKTAVVLTEETEMVAGKPYIYQATADAQTFSYVSGDIVSEPDANGPLTGALVPTQVPVGSYVMQTQNGVQAFYVVVEGKQPTISPYKAYLTVPATEAKMISFGEDSDATAIKALDAITSGNAKIYDLNGRELKSLQKGVNIVNGVKVLVK